jgi:hypothetical protein
VCVGRTLLSAAFDLDFLLAWSASTFLNFYVPESNSKSKSKSKAAGEGAHPTQTYLYKSFISIDIARIDSLWITIGFGIVQQPFISEEGSR